MISIKYITPICLLLLFPAQTIAQKLKVPEIDTQKDKVALREIVDAHLKATEELTQSLNPQTILKFYSKSYIGIQNGASQDLAELKKNLETVVRQIKEGSILGISTNVKNLNLRVQDRSAQVDYFAIVKIRMPNNGAQESEQTCTDDYVKEGSSWFIGKSKCSSLEKTKDAESKSQGSSVITPLPTLIVNNTFRVPAGNFQSFSFHLDKPGTVTGRFDIGGSRLSDIRVFLVNQFEYDNWRNNRGFRYYYASGQVVSGSIYANLPSGHYLLIFSNVHSLVMDATVRSVVQVQKR